MNMETCAVFGHKNLELQSRLGVFCLGHLFINILLPLLCVVCFCFLYWNYSSLDMFSPFDIAHPSIASWETMKAKLLHVWKPLYSLLFFDWLHLYFNLLPQSQTLFGVLTHGALKNLFFFVLSIPYKCIVSLSKSIKAANFSHFLVPISIRPLCSWIKFAFFSC